MQAATDLVLGMTILACALAAWGWPAVHRYWRATFAFAGAAAVAGGAHHALFAADWSWAVVGLLTASALSFLLLASAREVMGTRALRAVAAIRWAGLATYVGLVAARGEASLPVLLGAESLTMAGVLGLWYHAHQLGHPMAGPMTLAIGVSAMAGVAYAVPAALPGAVGLDPPSLSHLVLAPGVVLLLRAVRHGARSPAGSGGGTCTAVGRP